MTPDGPATRLHVGERVSLTVGPIAHGGHFVCRDESGQVIFLRHGITGEKVVAQITQVTSKIVRADVVEVVSKSEFRVDSPCEFSGAGRCGGCDFQHVDINHQRELKRQVIKEQFSRLAKLDVEVEVLGVAPNDGQHWRTRMDFAISAEGRIGLYAHRSNEVIPITSCSIAVEEMKLDQLSQRMWNGDARVEVAVSNTHQLNISRGGRSISGPTQLNEKVGDINYQLSPFSFWQSHLAAPATLVTAVLQLLELSSGDVVCDLYGGVGLFTAAIAQKVGAKGKVHLIESDRKAITDAQRIFKGVGNVEIHAGSVESRLPRISGIDLILLDPPRTGAGEEVVISMVKHKPRTIVYVSCDPASLARDTKHLAELGYRMDYLVGFDLFPMTQHVECISRFRLINPID